MARHTVVGILVVSLASIESASADAPEDKISADDANLILDVSQAFIKDCPSCTTPGINFDKREVKVQQEDLKLRDQWVKDAIDDPDRAVHFLITACELKAAPKIKVDVAVAKLWRVNTLSEPLGSALATLYQSCNNPPNADNQALMRRVKVIHIALARPWPQKDHHYIQHASSGYEYGLDKKTGELTIGVHNNASNVADAAAKWFRKQ